MQVPDFEGRFWVYQCVDQRTDSFVGEQEIQWVVPEEFFDTLPAVLEEVPARPGEEALYAWIESVLDAAAADTRIARG